MPKLKLREAFLESGVLADLGRLSEISRLTPKALEIIKRVHARLAQLPARMIVFESEIGAKKLPLERSIIPITGYLSSLAQREHTTDLLKANPELAYLALFQRNGYVRQLALEAIRHPPHSAFFLVALLHRLNDWAAPVRQAAAQCCLASLPALEPSTIVDASEFILLQMGAMQRLNPDAREIVNTLVMRVDVADALSQHFASNAAGPLVRQLNAALRHEDYDRHLPFLANHAQYAAVRRIAMRALINGRVDILLGYENQWTDKVYGLRKRVKKFEHRPLTISANPIEAIELALRDRSAMVRRVAAQAVIDLRSQLPNLSRYVQILSRDKNPSIRDRGDWLLRQS